MMTTLENAGHREPCGLGYIPCCRVEGTRGADGNRQQEQPQVHELDEGEASDQQPDVAGAEIEEALGEAGLVLRHSVEQPKPSLMTDEHGRRHCCNADDLDVAPAIDAYPSGQEHPRNHRRGQ